METPLTVFDQALAEVYAALPEQLAQELVEEAEAKSPLAHLDINATTQQFAAELLLLRQRCRNGMENILEKLKTTPELATKGKALDEFLHTTFQAVLTPSTFTRTVLRLVAGETWAEALKIPPESIDLMYQGAKSLFEEGLYEQASLCFTFLSWFDSRQYEFWMALGHCQFHTDSYLAAIRSYGVASVCLPTESMPFLYSASCFEAMGDIEQATLYLQEGMSREKAAATPNQSLIASIEKKMDETKKGFISPIS